MVYVKKDWRGNFEANLITDEELNNFLLMVNSKFEKQITDLSKQFEKAKQLSEKLEQQEQRKNGIINEELKALSNTKEKISSEVEVIKDKSIKEISELTTKSKDELQKKFVLELGIPLTDKNKSIVEVLDKFLTKLNYEMGGLDYSYMLHYKERFKSATPKLGLTSEMKEQLLEFCLNEQYWVYDKESLCHKNTLLHYLLLRLTNAIHSGRESSELIPIKSGQSKTIVALRNEQKKAEPKQQPEEETSEEDLYK